MILFKIFYNLCGIDFGTTNSAISVVDKNNKPELINFNGENTIPSAIFFPEDDTYNPIFGNLAIEQYINGGNGRFMRSLKRILGTDLMNLKTEVNEIKMNFDDIILKFIKHIKSTAESQINKELDSVVIGRPVHFQDFSPEADSKAESMLRNIVYNAGFKYINFQYEPLAAAYSHEATLDSECLACVVDIGGGTSDFSIIRLNPEYRYKKDRSDDILANTGIRIGGNDFDSNLSIKCFMPEFGYGSLLLPDDYTKRILPVPSSPYIMLSEWSSINSLYTYKERKNISQICAKAEDAQKLKRLQNVVNKELGHILLKKVEDCKILLSSDSDIEMLLPFIDDSTCIKANVGVFEESIYINTNKIKKALNECLLKANIKNKDISLLILTGGTTEIPYIKREITKIFPAAKVSDKDKMSSVAQGLSYEAIRLYK